MSIQLIVSAFLCCAGLPLLIRLLIASRDDAGDGVINPSQVSVIIPARNEEKNIPRLLHSLKGHHHPFKEIIVVNDDSTDRTAMVAEEGGAVVLHSRPLPAGWRGKPWACQQGADHSTADYLLFLDADVWLEEGGVARLVAPYQQGAYSVCPWHAVERPYEELSLFFNVNMAVGTAPGRLFGQMLLVDRASYDQVGGHATVRGDVLENLALSKRFCERNIKVRSALGKDRFRFRMYPGGIKDLMHGWAKGFRTGAAHTPPVILGLSIAWMSGLIMVPIHWAVTGALEFLALYLFSSVQVACIARTVGGFRKIAALLYPIPLVFFFVVFSMSFAMKGRKVQWKGRPINDI